MLYDLALGLQRAGQHVIVAAPIGSELPEGIRLLETVELPKEQDRDDLAVERLMQLADFDVVHDFSHGHRIASFNVNGCFMVWDPIVTRYPKSGYNVCCVSQWQGDRFIRLYEQNAMVFPKWGYVGPDYKPVKHPKRDRFLFVGKLTPNKGALEAIDFAKRMGVSLDVVGGLIPSDSQEYLNRLIQHEGDGVKIWFNAMESTKIQLLQNAKAVLYPLQFDEAHNLVAIEAAQVKTPMIAYNRGALRQLGICKTVDNPEDFLWAMKTVDDWWVPSKEDWSVDSRVETYLSFYKQVADGLRW